MKVAYNACYGGFSLSAIAETEYRAKKGITLTWYEGLGPYPYSSFVRIDDIEALPEKRRSVFSISASIKDFGESIDKIPSDSYFYESWYGRENRNDPDLIEVLERLGSKANGDCARIEIKEIPDDAAFEITEYDGMEGVEPPRTSW